MDRAVFQPGDRVELVGGQLVVREPQGSPHAVAVRLAEDVIRTAFGSGWEVRGQMPVALDDESEPEPDVAVCAGSPRDYLVTGGARFLGQHVAHALRERGCAGIVVPAEGRTSTAQASTGLRLPDLLADLVRRRDRYHRERYGG